MYCTLYEYVRMYSDVNITLSTVQLVHDTVILELKQIIRNVSCFVSSKAYVQRLPTSENTVQNYNFKIFIIQVFELRVVLENQISTLFSNLFPSMRFE